MPKKLTYDYVKSYIESQGYQLLSKEYKNNREKLRIKCPLGHEFKTKFNYFQQNRKCPICANNNKKLSYNYIKSYIESYGYQLLSDEYKNSQTKLSLQCPKNHIYKSTFDGFKGGNRCPICNGNKKYTYDDIKSYIESYGYQLLSNEYKNSAAKLLLQCPWNHEFKMSYNHFQQGQRCPICYNEKRKTPYEKIKSYIESYGYKLLSRKYENNNTKILVQCNKGHIYKTKFSYFKTGNRCPICWYNSTSSKAEKEIQSFIRTIYDKTIICNDRDTIINPYTGYNLELDIYLPDINKAVEYNGDYWHSFTEKKIYDKIKRNQCKSKNIDLIIIKENEWNKNKSMCLKKIKDFIYLKPLHPFSYSFLW